MMIQVPIRRSHCPTTTYRFNAVIEPRFYKLRRPPEPALSECVLLTPDNLNEVAEWSGGTVVDEGVEGLGSLRGPILVRATPGMMVCKRPYDRFLYVRDADSFHAEYIEAEK